MVSKKIEPNVQTFTILVNAYCKEGLVEEAQDVVEVMIKRGLQPNIVTYCALMDGYCLRNQLDLALEVFNAMVSKGFAPNVFSYSILINGYCKSKKTDEAMNIFRQMLLKGLIPNTVTFTTLIGGLFHVGKPRIAKNSFKRCKPVEYFLISRLVLFCWMAYAKTNNLLRQWHCFNTWKNASCTSIMLFTISSLKICVKLDSLNLQRNSFIVYQIKGCNLM